MDNRRENDMQNLLWSWHEDALRIFAVTIGVLLSTISGTAQNAITDWNAIAITNARASTAPGAATPGGTNIYVTYAELAVYNAVVAIQGGYQPYKYNVTAPAGASADAAVIEAAYRMLVHLLPDRLVPLNSLHCLDGLHSRRRCQAGRPVCWSGVSQRSHFLKSRRRSWSSLAV